MEQASGAGLTNAQYKKPINFLAREKGCQQMNFLAREKGCQQTLLTSFLSCKEVNWLLVLSIGKASSRQQSLLCRAPWFQAKLTV